LLALQNSQPAFLVFLALLPTAAPAPKKRNNKTKSTKHTPKNKNMQQSGFFRFWLY